MTLSSLIVRLTPILFVLLWSTGFIGSKMGAPYSEPFSFLAVRYVAVLAILLVSMAVFPGEKSGGRAEKWHSVVVGVLIHGCYLGGIFWSIDNGMPAGIAALIVGLQPMLTALISGLFYGESVTLRHWIGIAVGLVGVAMVLGPKAGLAGAGIDPMTVSVAFGGVVAIAAGTVYQKRFVPGVDFRTGAVYQYIGALGLTLVGVLLLEEFRIEWTGEFLFALGWLVLVLSIGAIMLLMVLIREGAVSKVATLFYLVPAATALESYFLFGEELTLIQLAGMAVVITAVAMTSRRARKQIPAEPF